MVAQLRLHAIKAGIGPEPKRGSVGIIGLPTWLWFADPGPATTGPITRSVTERGFTVTATAKVSRVVWRMGDGALVSCLGRGTPNTDSYGRSPHPQGIFVARNPMGVLSARFTGQPHERG